MGLQAGTYYARVTAPTDSSEQTNYKLVLNLTGEYEPDGDRPSLHSNPTESNPLKGFQSPVRGERWYVSQSPGGSYSHTGNLRYAIDISIPGWDDFGKPIYAMRPGTVKKVVDYHPDTTADPKQNNLVEIQHENGYVARYWHLQQNSNSDAGLQVGQKVDAGQMIGRIGNSGWSTGPHLHVDVVDSSFRTRPFEIEGIFNYSSTGDNDSNDNDQWETYIVQPGDTLSDIAFGTTGDSSRYLEIAKYNKIDEPYVIYVGQRIKVPGNSSTGTTDNSNNEIIKVPGDSSTGTTDNSNRKELNFELKELNFELNKTSLWGSGNQGFKVGEDWGFNKDKNWSFLNDSVQFDVEMEGDLNAYMSTGTADIKLPGVFDFKYDNTSNEFTVSSNIAKGDTLFSSYLGAGVGIEFELAAGIKINDDIPWVGGSNINFKPVSLELDGVDFVTGILLDKLIPGASNFLTIDANFKIEDREFDQNRLDGDDSVGIEIDLAKWLLQKSDNNSDNNQKNENNEDASHILKGSVKADLNQKSILELIGFRFDKDNDDISDFEVNIGETRTEQFTGSLDDLRVQPITKLKTTFTPQLSVNIGASLENAINSVIPDDTPPWVKDLLKIDVASVNFNPQFSFEQLKYTVNEFNPFYNYWLPFK
jgi:murein DD-endopeptidase MepM/ murein hydrolase activator NlpD